MKAHFLATVSAVALAGTASAADLPVKMQPVVPAPIQTSWTGFYIGLSGGAAWLNSDFSAFDAVGNTSEGTVNASGGMLGGQVGYNWQMQNFVVGVEGDISWVDANDTATPTFWNGGYINAKLTSLATIRGRAGILVTPEALVYATGGWAWGRLTHDTNVFNLAVGDSSKSGWTIGGGIEYMLAPHWTVKAEGLYVDLGSTSTTATPYGTGYGATFKDSAAVARVGANFKF